MRSAIYRNSTWNAALLVLIVSLGGCCCSSHTPDPKQVEMCPMGDFQASRHETIGNLDVSVFVPKDTGARPIMPLVLLHEIPGMNSSYYMFAKELTEAGFTVYGPRMFGAEHEDSTLGQFKNKAFVFLSPSWSTFATQSSPPVLASLRKVVDQVVAENPNRPVGVIGQCLSGPLSFALLANDHVRAAAICQPALPLVAFTQCARSDLGLSESDIKATVEQLKQGGRLVLCFRFETDTISKAERFRTIRENVPANDTFEDRTILASETAASFGAHPHSVFAESYDPTDGSVTKERLSELVAKFTHVLSQPLHP